MAKTRLKGGLILVENGVERDIFAIGTELDALEAVTLRQMSCVVVYGDDGSAVSLGEIPAGAQIVDYIVSVTEAFDGSGTDIMIAGTTADPDAIFESLDVAAAGYHDKTDLTEGAEVALQAAARDIEVLYVDQNSDATQGAATITLIYAEVA